MSLTWAFSLADREDDEGIVNSVSGRHRLSPISPLQLNPNDPNPRFVMSNCDIQ